jgi:hypothetical protein
MGARGQQRRLNVDRVVLRCFFQGNDVDEAALRKVLVRAVDRMERRSDRIAAGASDRSWAIDRLASDFKTRSSSEHQLFFDEPFRAKGARPDVHLHSAWTLLATAMLGGDVAAAPPRMPSR